MTEDEKLTILASLTGESADSTLLQSCLDYSREKIMARAYPFDSSADFPERYDNLHVEIAKYLCFRLGAEGEIVHLENGVSRHFEDGDIPMSMLREVTPAAGVL